jgi:hypothetical protein
LKIDKIRIEDQFKRAVLPALFSFLQQITFISDATRLDRIVFSREMPPPLEGL